MQYFHKTNFVKKEYWYSELLGLRPDLFLWRSRQLQNPSLSLLNSISDNICKISSGALEAFGEGLVVKRPYRIREVQWLAIDLVNSYLAFNL